ncbi:FISUMP domain-containing protein [Aquimarina aggregata]|uniref:FISUMP domain-containing protein n=1 Tax=Aquimarina aggregata TaxID=1642818 RepID=UPI002492D88A|nr:FISUMP domain-containing protein [Aquimarina aggregata]
MKKVKDSIVNVLLICIAVFFGSCNDDDNNNDPNPFEVEVKITEITCSTDGAVDLTITGGTPPFNYLWSTGATTNGLTNILSPITLKVTIKDNNGVTKVLDIDVVKENCDSFTDVRDNKEYKTIKNGDQIWMYEPLSFNTPGSIFLFDDPSYADQGRMYRWELVMNGETVDVDNPKDIKGICPEGFHIPSPEEWKVFESFLRREQSSQGSIKWSNYLASYASTTYLLVDFQSGVTWYSGGQASFATNTSETYILVGNSGHGSMDYKLTTEYPENRYWTEYKHFCHCIKNN